LKDPLSLRAADAERERPAQELRERMSAATLDAEIARRARRAALHR